MPPLLTILLLGLALCWAGGVIAVRRVLTRPPRRTYASAVARGRAGDPGELDPPRRFESWHLDASTARLPVWDLSGDDPDGPVVIMSHGWGDSRIGALQRLPLVLRGARRVVAWDMPGHGDAPGPSHLGTTEVDDLLRLVERVAASESPGQARGIVLLGWSLGAGVSIAAAARAPGGPIEGVIAEAPYRLPSTPASRMLRVMRWPEFGMLGTALWLASWQAPALRRPRDFDRARLASQVPCPLLVLHGEQDEICPIADGRAIASAAPRGAIECFAGATHNDLWQNEHRLARGEAAVRVFLSKKA